MRPMAISVFLLDDHEVVRRGVRELLEAEGDLVVVGEAGTTQDALAQLRACSPDVALIDVQLPDGSGIEVCRAAREQHPELRCLILTSFDDDEALAQAVVAGAVGYLLKQVRGSDIVTAVRRAASGHTLLPPALVQRAEQRLVERHQTAERLGQLTLQERRVLNCLARGMTNRQIAEELFVAEKTVKNYVSGVLAKLGMGRRTEAAVFAARSEEQARHRPHSA